MSDQFSDTSISEITSLLQEYFDGLYDGDLDVFGRIFHDNAHLYTTDGSEVTDLPRTEYFRDDRGTEVRKQPGPETARPDRVHSQSRSGHGNGRGQLRNTAQVLYRLSDFAALEPTAGQIISKTFHIDMHE